MSRDKQIRGFEVDFSVALCAFETNDVLRRGENMLPLLRYMRYCFDFNQEFFFSTYLLFRETISSRFLRSSLYDSFERCFEEPCFLFGQEVREVLSYSPGINGPGVPERR